MLGLTEPAISDDPSGRAQRLVLRPIEAVAVGGYYSGEVIVACEQAVITVYLPKPMTSGLLAKEPLRQAGLRLHIAADRDVYLCPAGEQLNLSHYTNEEEGKTLRRYWTTACQACVLKSNCTARQGAADLTLGARSRP